VKKERAGLEKQSLKRQARISNYALFSFFILLFSFFTVVAIFLLVRGVGAIAGLVFGSDGVIAAALSQLANARIIVPVWIPLCVAAAVCAFRVLPVKHPPRNAAIITPLSVAILLFAFVAAFLLTRVNGVFVHVTIGIIRMLLESGLF